MFNSASDLAPPPAPKPLGKDTATLATEEHGRPVPYLAGRRRLGLTWIADAWGVRSAAIKRKVGKNKETVGYNYYASFAGVLCLGPVQTLHAISVDEDQVWEGPLEAGSDEHADITVEGRGPIRLYWGTETQAVDLTLAASGLLHPAYRGQCYVVFDDWLLGENRSQVPPIEFEVSRIPQGSGLATSAALNGETHPLAVLEELLRNRRFGAGLDAGLIDYASWDAAAARLAAEGFSVSVALDQATRLDALLNDFLEYLDACLVHTPDGKLSLRLLREGGEAVTLGAGDLIESPDLTAHGWPETVNEVVVRFANRARTWQTDAVAFRDPAAYAVTRRPLTRQVECDWITDQAVAWRVAAGLARTQGLPWLEGSLRVRRGVADLLRPGDTVELTYAPQGIEAVRFRVLGVEVPGPDSPDLRLSVREDTAHLLGTEYQVPADSPTEAQTWEPQPCHAVLVFELPHAWTHMTDPRLLILPARGETLSNRFTAYWERSPDSFQIAAEGEVFGRRGTLNVALDSEGAVYAEGALDVTLTSPDDDLEDMPFAEGVDAGQFLIFIGDEVLLGWAPVLTGLRRYTVSVLRGQKGTLRGDHAVGAEVWLVQLAAGQQLTEITFSGRYQPGDRVTFKVQTHLLQRELGLSDAPEIPYLFTRRAGRPLGPENLQAQGDGVAPTYRSGDAITLTWTLTSEDRTEVEPTVAVLSTADQCVLELWAGGVLKGTLYADERPPYTIPNAVLIARLGAEITFTLRAYLSRAGYRSLDFDEITVSRI